MTSDFDPDFIPPYSFVPFPLGTCQRSEPPGHDRLRPEAFSGTLAITWTSLSDVVVSRGTPWSAACEFPGSSAKGVARSLHETLAGGCLRVIDTDYLPTYRSPISKSSEEGWELCWIQKVDKGRPTAVRRCSETIWVNLDCISGVVKTGKRLRFDRGDINESSGRRTLKQGEATVVEDGDYVMLVTDPGARSPRSPYYVACGQIKEEAVDVDVPSCVWNGVLRRLRDTDDARDDSPTARDGYKLVEWPGENPRKMWRRSITDGLLPGDVVWARLKVASERKVEVEDLKLSQIWRDSGKHPLGERIPKHLHPCTKPNYLCASCRIFGAADEDGSGSTSDDDRVPTNRQRSYRGHLRFSPITAKEASLGKEATKKKLLLAQPRLSAGQMYLENRKPQGDREHQSDSVPARNWGSALDGTDKGPRQLRGRKYYWASATQRTQELDAASDGIVSEVTTVGAEHQWRSTVKFENLTTADLGGVLAALQPSLAFEYHKWKLEESKERNNQAYVHRGNEGGEYTVRLGGGKPLGFGIFRTCVVIKELHSAHSRYGYDSKLTNDMDGFVKRCLSDFLEATPNDIKDTWPDLAAMLHTEHLTPCQTKKLRYAPSFADGKDKDWWAATHDRVPEHRRPRAERQGYKMPPG